MSLVANKVAPVLLIVPSLISLVQAGPSVGTLLSLTASVALQLTLIRRCALGGLPSNGYGVFALFYPILLILAIVLSILASFGAVDSALLGSSKKGKRGFVRRVRNILAEKIRSDEE